jgi:hypothetical protein
VTAAKDVKAYQSDRGEYERLRLGSADRVDFGWGLPYPCYGDRHDDAGQATGHYFHQDLFVARLIHERGPQRHIDVGSSVYGFVSHVASFREIEVLDVRPLAAQVPGIRFERQDVCKLDASWDGAADSVSCLHALEHFGLGRYGDDVDPDGWTKGLTGLTRLVRADGYLYLSVPTGLDQRVEFNAQRVFTLPFVRDHLTGAFDIDQLAFVADDGSLLSDLDPYGADAERSFDASYGCSIWVLRKR